MLKRIFKYLLFLIVAFVIIDSLLPFYYDYSMDKNYLKHEDVFMELYTFVEKRPLIGFHMNSRTNYNIRGAEYSEKSIFNVERSDPNLIKVLSMNNWTLKELDTLVTLLEEINCVSINPVSGKNDTLFYLEIDYHSDGFFRTWCYVIFPVDTDSMSAISNTNFYGELFPITKRVYWGVPDWN